MGRGHHHVVTRLATQQPGLQGFIVVVGVIAHPDARLTLKTGDGVLRRILGPVVYVDHFALGMGDG